MFFRSSYRRCSVRERVLRNLAKFIGNTLCQGLLFNKVAGLRPAALLKKWLWDRWFPVNFAKFLRTLFLQNTSKRLLLVSGKCFNQSESKSNMIVYIWLMDTVLLLDLLPISTSVRRFSILLLYNHIVVAPTVRKWLVALLLSIQIPKYGHLNIKPFSHDYKHSKEKSYILQ